MNKNIEVINDKLWALNFSLIPYIKEISYTPDSYFDEYKEFGRMLDDKGVILLNKDHAGYALTKKSLLKAMRYSNSKLKRLIKRLSDIKDKTPLQLLNNAAYMVELERREKAKGR